MATQTFACPACGSHKTLDDPQPGEKLHCTCGMSFPASPVFAVAAVARGNRLTGTGWAVGVAGALLIGTAAAAGWLMTRPQARTPDPTDGPVAVGPTQPAPRTQPLPDQPSTAAVDPSAPTTPPDQPPPIPPPTASPSTPPSTPVESVSAVTLWDAFDLDQPAAEARYTGKVLEVTARGKLGKDSIGKTYFGAVVVQPRGKVSARLSQGEQRWEKEGYPPSVRCYLSPDQAALLEKVSADRDVTLRGTCTGRKNRQDVYRGYIVELENCTVVVPR
jgi:type IV secretory pathway VirB10-like protein